MIIKMEAVHESDAKRLAKSFHDEGDLVGYKGKTIAVRTAWIEAEHSDDGNILLKLFYGLSDSGKEITEDIEVFDFSVKNPSLYAYKEPKL